MTKQIPSTFIVWTIAILGALVAVVTVALGFEDRIDTKIENAVRNDSQCLRRIEKTVVRIETEIKSFDKRLTYIEQK